MILAAGFGTRLRPLTEAVPKPLLRVAGRPIIEYPLLLLRAAGIRDVVINLHHLGDQIRKRLGDGSAYGLRIVYSTEEEILDTGGGIKKAEALLSDGSFVVINSDTIMDAPLEELIARQVPGVRHASENDGLKTAQPAGGAQETTSVAGLVWHACLPPGVDSHARIRPRPSVLASFARAATPL